MDDDNRSHGIFSQFICNIYFVVDTIKYERQFLGTHFQIYMTLHAFIQALLSAAVFLQRFSFLLFGYCLVHYLSEGF